MSTIANVKILKLAYEWEQAQIKAWLMDLDNHDEQDLNGNDNAMVKEFAGIWKLYFGEIMESNAEVIKQCAAAIKGNSKKHAENVRDHIRDVFHRELSLRSVRDAALHEKKTSRYFESINNGLDLEDVARASINKFLF